MSFGRRILDEARDGISRIVDRIAADDTPLSHVDKDELAAELADRKAAREASGKSPGDNPVARMAGAGDAARARRRKASQVREGRIKSEQKKREDAARAAHERAFREAQARAAREQARRGSAGRSTGSTSGSRRRARAGGFPFGGKDDKIAAHYKTLDLPDGAPFPEVKAQYRKLMRKYHPDRHVGNPKKLKAATELTMRVTQAYNALEEHLNK